MIFSGFGHRPDELGGYSKDTLAKLIAFAVETIPQFGPTKIISGMTLGWEQALAMAAIELEIPLTIALPFQGQEKVWPDKAQAFYHSVLDRATEVKLVCPGGFDAKKFWERDQWTIEHCDALFVLWKNWENPGDEISDILEANPGIPDFSQATKPPKNTNGIMRRALEYAEDKDRHIYHLWPMWETFLVDVSFEDFRDSLMNMSLDER